MNKYKTVVNDSEALPYTTKNTQNNTKFHANEAKSRQALEVRRVYFVQNFNLKNTNTVQNVFKTKPKSLKTEEKFVDTARKTESKKKTSLDWPQLLHTASFKTHPSTSHEFYTIAPRFKQAQQQGESEGAC